MFRRMLIGVLCPTLAFGVALGGEFPAQVIRVHDGIATIAKSPKKGNVKAVGREIITIPIDSACKVFDAKYNPTTKTLERGQQLPDGLRDERLVRYIERLEAEAQKRKNTSGKGRTIQRGFIADLVTSEDDKLIKEIIVHTLPVPLTKPRAGQVIDLPKPQTVSNLSPNASASFEYVMMGLKENRDRLSSGVFRAYGMYTDLQAPSNLHANINFFCAFDRPSHRVRFDRTLATDPKALQGKEFNKGKAPKIAPLIRGTSLLHQKGAVVLTPTQSLAMGPYGNVIIYPPNSDQLPIRPFDIRALGLYYWLDFEQGMPFEELYNILRTNKPREIGRDPKGYWKLIWEFTQPIWSEHTTWIDETSGFSVVRRETRVARGKPENVTWDLISVNTASWTLREEVWVPETYHIEDITKEGNRACDLAFEWETINNAIPGDLFTVDGLGKGPKLVFDATKGDRVLVSGGRNRTSAPRSSAQARVNRRYGLRWLIAANSALVVAIVAYCYVRRRRRVTSSPA